MRHSSVPAQEEGSHISLIDSGDRKDMSEDGKTQSPDIKRRATPILGGGGVLSHSWLLVNSTIPCLKVLQFQQR